MGHISLMEDVVDIVQNILYAAPLMRRLDMVKETLELYERVRDGVARGTYHLPEAFRPADFGIGKADGAPKRLRSTQRVELECGMRIVRQTREAGTKPRNPKVKIDEPEVANLPPREEVGIGESETAAGESERIEIIGTGAQRRVVYVRGRELGPDEARELGATLERLIDEGARDMAIDLSEVEKLSSTALGAIIRAWRVIKPLGGKVRIIPSEAVRGRINRAGFGDVLFERP